MSGELEKLVDALVAKREPEPAGVGAAAAEWLGHNAPGEPAVACSECGVDMPLIDGPFGAYRDGYPDGRCRGCHDGESARRQSAALAARAEGRRQAGLAAGRAMVAAFPKRYQKAAVSDLARPVAARVREWLNGDAWLLYLHGVTGGGKTHAAHAALRNWAGDHVDTIADTPAERWYILDLLKVAQGEAVFDTDRPNAGTVARLCRTPAAVLIDDLGTGKPTDFAVQEIGRIVHHREADELPTIITSNYTLDDLTMLLTGRVSRRLTTGIAVEFTEVYSARGDRPATSNGAPARA